jgi:hypothetical protein
VRSLIGVAAAAAFAGMGGDVLRADNETEGKAREDREAQEREQQEMYEHMRARRLAERDKRAADMQKLRDGIDPTNGNPLSRQQRRALRRHGFRFASQPSNPQEQG